MDEKLEGLEIVDARYDGDSIFLNLKDGRFITMTPYGDCCANCYVQHVSGSEALVGATITRMEDIESNLSPEEAEEVSDYNVVDAWGHLLVTNKGRCSIEMRVSHNGYYGGSLNFTMGDGANQSKLLEDF